MPDDGDLFSDAVRTEAVADASEHEQQLAALDEARRQIDQRLDCLLAAHLDGDVTTDEYRRAKARMLTEKQQVLAKRGVVTASRDNRFEPVKRFVSSLNEARLVASTDNTVVKRDL